MDISPREVVFPRQLVPRRAFPLGACPLENNVILEWNHLSCGGRIDEEPESHPQGSGTFLLPCLGVSISQLLSQDTWELRI